MRAAVRWLTPASAASARVVGSFSPGSSVPSSIAVVKRSISCCVSDLSPSRRTSVKLILYDIERPADLGDTSCTTPTKVDIDQKEHNDVRAYVKQKPVF